MVTLDKRRTGIPLLQASDGSIIRPKRVSFTQKTFDEYQIQELIRTNPDILPVDEIESVFSPLISIGREVPTNAGSIDNLYLSSQGYLILVETKLWRNPEARREVVGQIIDYAKEISKWSFKQLEDQVRSYNQKYRNANLGIVETLEQELGEEVDETSIIEAISQNIQRGRFLLLIVGDGIHKSVEDMVEFLAQTPQLQFTLALVELQIYEFEDKSRLIMPQIVTRTKEITRAVVKIEAKEISSIKVEVVEGETDPEKKFFNDLGKSVTPELVTFAKSLIKDMEILGCIVEWHSASYVMKLPAPNGHKLNLSIVGVYKYGQVFIGSLANQLKKIGLPEQIGLDYAKNTALLFQTDFKKDSPTEWANFVKLEELREKYSDFKAEVEKTINLILDTSGEAK
jgi:ribosomal protein L18